MLPAFRLIFLRRIHAWKWKRGEGKLPSLLWRWNRCFSFSVAVCKPGQSQGRGPSPRFRAELVLLWCPLCLWVWRAILKRSNGTRLCLLPPDSPSQRVQFILGTEEDEQHVPHDLFSQLDEICVKEGEEAEWKESAR